MKTLLTEPAVRLMTIQAKMAAEIPNLEAVNSALRAVKLLRSTVGDVFKCLADCPLIPSSNQSPVDETAPNGTTVTPNGTANIAASPANNQPVNNAAATASHDKQLAELQTLLSTVNNRFRDLETACTLLMPMNSSAANISLGNSTLLGQDPNYEKTNLYSDMISAYRWSDKMIEYSSIACSLLQQNAQRRSLTSNLYIKGRPQRRTPNGHNIPNPQIDLFIQTLQRQMPELSIEMSRPFGSPTVLKVTIPRVMKAVILLRGLLIEWVVVKGFDESFDDPNSDNSYVKRIRTGNAISEPERLDIWSESKYEVFRKVTEHVNAAMLHFYSPTHCDLAIKTFLVCYILIYSEPDHNLTCFLSQTWLKSYSNLFSAACRKCNCRLLNFMPPTWRDFRQFEAYHEQCRP